MKLLSPLLVAIIATVFAAVVAVTIDHDKVQPFAQPEPKTVSEKAGIKFKPNLKIGNACHPYPAVKAAGETSGGLKGTGKFDADCTGSALGSQVYGRAVWYKDLWAIMYSYYFPKAMYYSEVTTFKKGHRHMWVSAVVWLDNPALEKPKVLAVSTTAVGGGYAIRKNTTTTCYRRLSSHGGGDSPPPQRNLRHHRPRCDPPFPEYFNDTSAMLGYTDDYLTENMALFMTTDRGAGDKPDLIMWEQLTDEARSALSETDFGENVKVPFVDANFDGNLEAARPFF